MISFKLWRSKQ